MSDQAAAHLLPIKSITYNHGARRIVVDFLSAQFVINRPVELVIGENRFRQKTWEIAVEGKPARIVVVFDDVVFDDLDTVCIIKSHANGPQVHYEYRPSEHIVVDWTDAPAQLEDLTTLIAFPRSGGHFLQNVIDKNTSGIFCATIYAQEAMMRKRMNLKSHALNMGDVRLELRAIWEIERPKFNPIILMRDPRDIFLSMYDYIWKKRKIKIDPKVFLDSDYYWYFFEPEQISTIRASQTDAISMIDAYKMWHRNWVAPIAQPPNSLCVKYEDLVNDPFTVFSLIFSHIGEEMPKDLQALDQMVAQAGASQRTRAEPQGWRNAPQMYTPIISAVSSALKNELSEMGYE